MQNQICIVTGANGFIGQTLIPHLISLGIPVRACVRSRVSPEQFQVGDLATFNDWTTLFQGAYSVVHMAAKVHDMSNPPYEAYYEQNVSVTKKLATEAKKHGVQKFIFISSIKVNGELTESRPFLPEDTVLPLDPYGRSKLEAEQEILKLHEPNVFEVTVIRPCLIYGKGVKANFNSLIGLVKKGLPLPFASIQNKRSFVSVYNLVDLIAVTLNNPKAGGHVFLVSDGIDLSLPALIRQIAFAMNRKVILMPFPAWLFKVLFKLIGRSDMEQRLFGNLHVDIEKTEKTLNWKPPYTTQQSLQKMFGD